ncbi:MAG: CaiB/BaiF CoA transferase family protein, partial [Dehalococcoidia bacterium]
FQSAVPPDTDSHAEASEDSVGSSRPTPDIRFPTPTRLPLAGLKVVDFSWVMAGPMSVRYLADYGATVVHVESSTRIDTARTIGPFKDGQPGPERSGLYANANAGKLGLTLNLSLAEARQVAFRLAAWADIVVEGYSPKAMRAWGLDYAALRAVNPGLIMLSTCLNGQTGPQASLAGFGTMGSALAGFVELTGWPDRDPAGPMGAYTDYVTPKFTAAALLAALAHRRRTGEGQYIDFSQTEAGIHFLAPAMLDYTVNGRVQTRAGNASPAHAPHGVYPAAGDDRWVAIAATSEQQWQALCTATEHREWQQDPRYATEAGRVQHYAVLDAELAAWTRGQDVEAIETKLQRAGVPVHRASSSVDAFGDPQLQFRGHFLTFDHPQLGLLPIEASRMRFSRTPAQVRWPGPTFGQHNEQVLREILDMSDEEIAALTMSGALE